MHLCGDQLAVVTSSGAVSVLDISAVREGKELQDTRTSTHQVDGDPRFICVVNWSSDDALVVGTTDTSKGVKGKKKRHVEDEEGVDSKKKGVAFADAAT
jgi:hypothetical protein